LHGSDHQSLLIGQGRQQALGFGTGHLFEL
jgi:hypothetical protein